MKTSGIITADVHLTDNARDEQRWGLIPWLADQAINHDCTWLGILGDGTEAKDRHSAKLVNRLVAQLSQAAAHVDVYWLYGNHDGLDPANPFFHFINAIEGVTFITEPLLVHEADAWFLPCTNDWEKDWAGVLPKVNAASRVFTHQTYVGALRENGTKSDRGVPPAVFKDFKGKVWSGDIHTRQRIGKNIEYVGAPYRIDFGDTYNPRVVLLPAHGQGHEDLIFPCPSKDVLTLTGTDMRSRLSEQEYGKGDQVKVRVVLKRAEYVEWPKYKKMIEAWAQEQGVDLYGPTIEPADETKAEGVLPGAADIDPITVMERQGRKRSIDADLMAIGLSILEDVR